MKGEKKDPYVGIGALVDTFGDAINSPRTLALRNPLAVSIAIS